MFDIILGSILAFGSVICCFFFFLGGSYIGMFSTVITLIIGLFFVGKAIFFDSTKSDGDDAEICYGVLQYYTSDICAELSIYVPSIGNNKMISYTFDNSNYAIGTCFIVSYLNDEFLVEDVIPYPDIPEEFREYMVVYPANYNAVDSNAQIYSTVEQNS